MPIESVIFSQTSGRAVLRIESPGELRRTLESKLPAAIVTRSCDLNLFLASGKEFVVARRTNPARPLTKVLLGWDGQVPVLDARYSSAGRLTQGVETLLDNAEKNCERGLYVIGVSDQVFAQAKQEVTGVAPAADEADGCADLSELLEELPVSQSLLQCYLGDSKDHRLVRQLIIRAARTDETVLIVGATGTGKNVVAEKIHELSARQPQPFVKINCASIPSELLESELFGYMRGAFTDARTDKAGQWELAGSGTLFLDEIGDLRPDHQAKLLHALQDRKIRRVGGKNEIAVNARVIAATNRNLYGMVQSERFRQDLYYRLRQFVIRTPDLQEDPHTLAEIAQSIWGKIMHTDKRLPPEIIEDLCDHRWPGNVRELRSVLSTLANFFGDRAIRREHLRAVFQYCGLATNEGEENVDEVDTLRVDCLRQIHRADEVVRACEEALKRFAEGSAPAAEQAVLQRNCLELEAILRQRLRFGSQEAYQAIHRLEEDLKYFLSMPAENNRALERFQRTLSADIEEAVAQLFRQQQDLMSSD